MEKQVMEKFGKTYYLLGIDKNGNKVWLLEASWECGWYWGLGYIQTFNKKQTDINSHSHFDTLFFKKDSHKSYIKCFNDVTLTDKEIWQLLELMKSLYILRKYSDMLYCGGAYITENPCKAVLKSDEEYKRINQVVIPSLNKKIYELLGGKNVSRNN